MLLSNFKLPLKYIEVNDQSGGGGGDSSRRTARTIYHRKYHRMFEADEYPLLANEFSFNHASSSTTRLNQQQSASLSSSFSDTNSNNISPYILYIRGKPSANDDPLATISDFKFLRRKQCQILSVPSLQRRLDSLEREEELMLEEINNRCKNLKNLIETKKI